MIMPSKTIKPIDSLFSMGSFTIKLLQDKELSTDELYDNFSVVYPKKVEIEKFLLVLTFLNALGSINYNYETDKIKLN